MAFTIHADRPNGDHSKFIRSTVVGAVFKAADLMGNGWTRGIHPEDIAMARRTYEGAFDARQDFTMQYRLRRGDGEPRLSCSCRQAIARSIAACHDLRKLAPSGER